MGERWVWLVGNYVIVGLGLFFYWDGLLVCGGVYYYCDYWFVGNEGRVLGE